MTTPPEDYTRLTPASELDARIQGLRQILSNQDIGGALIVQKADLFYYTGTTQQGWLYVPVQGDPVFMVFKDLARAKAESGIDQILFLISPKNIPDTLAKLKIPFPDRLGLELDVMPANLYLMFSQIFESAKVIDISTQIRLQRAVKSSFEISCVKRASALADRVAAKVPELLKAGMKEIELAGMLESFARSLGHQGLIRMRMWDNYLFYGHIMCGAGAAVPGAFASPTGGAGLNPNVGQGPSFAAIKPNEPILVDYVFALDGYLSDHARIFSLGEVSDDLQKAHTAMLDIQEVVKKQAVPGTITGDIYETMMAMAAESGYKDNFMGAAEPKIRFTGHGLGIELDEFPFIAKGQTLALEAGMLIALEPKVIFPGQGVVGIENTLLVTDTGLESLTLYPDTITVL
ncbi:MAG: Xaa-Pro peptidase family protein [Proteobacteria bacterium]|nr:aminopeptidase P family protein [Desulfobacula sp.]MBU3953902.1 Xaa-Pro peptidase family protein [Pseudomonadota bacterium]MBU4129260.1 Xaa-Pro peptidase family protein [Pseudomonadota bacterium]